MYGTQGGWGHCSGVSPLWLLIHNAFGGTHTQNAVAEGRELGGQSNTSVPHTPPLHHLLHPGGNWALQERLLIGDTRVRSQQQMRPDSAGLPRVLGLGLCSGHLGALGMWAELDEKKHVLLTSGPEIRGRTGWSLLAKQSLVILQSNFSKITAATI